MRALRRLLLTHRRAALLVVLLALALRAAVPGGFMLAAVDGHVAVTLCPGSGPMPAMSMAEPGHSRDMQPQPQGKADQSCAYAALAFAALGGADPVLLAIALLFAMAMALLPDFRPGASAPPRLRPPLRGPPILH